MLIYKHHPETGEFLLSKTAFPNPLAKGEFLIPANATENAPPNPKSGHVAVFSNGSWETKIDNRNKSYWTPLGEMVVIAKIGEEIPADALFDEPDLRTLDEAKQDSIRGVVMSADQFTASILEKYPAAEKAGWPQKQAECTIIVAADDASGSISLALDKTVLMKTIAAAAGWDEVATVAAARAIITKANEFAAIAAMVEVMRLTAETTINAVSDMAELETVKISLIEQAQALAAQFGLA